MKAHITLQQLELNVFLGWTEQERQQAQTVTVDIDLALPAPPVACTSDQLDDTYCYADLIEKIKKEIEGKPFRLIEKLSHSIYQTVKNTLPADIKINVTVSKKPSISGLTGGVKFCYLEHA